MTVDQVRRERPRPVRLGGLGPLRRRPTCRTGGLDLVRPPTTQTAELSQPRPRSVPATSGRHERPALDRTAHAARAVSIGTGACDGCLEDAPQSGRQPADRARRRGGPAVEPPARRRRQRSVERRRLRVGVSAFATAPPPEERPRLAPSSPVGPTHRRPERIGSSSSATPRRWSPRERGRRRRVGRSAVLEERVVLARRSPRELATGERLGRGPALGLPAGGDVRRRARAGRDELADDDVLLEADEPVLGAVDGGLGQHPRRLLEGGRGEEAAGVERCLGDAQQDRLGGGGLAALGQDLVVDAPRTRSGRRARTGSCSLSPGWSMRTLRSICRTMISMCLSLIVTPWLR